MCFPMIAPMVGLMTSVIGAGAQISAQNKQYDQQVAQYNQNYQNALAADRDNQVALTQRQMQEQDATSQKAHQQQVAAAQTEAGVNVSAAGANVSGLSVDSLIADTHRELDYNMGALKTNYVNTADQLQRQKDASVDQAQSRIQSVPVPVAPDPTGPIIGAIGGGLKAFGSANASGSFSSLNFSM